MFNLTFKKEQKRKRANKAREVVALQVKQILESGNQGLISMVRG